jgi:hypothetical protein
MPEPVKIYFPLERDEDGYPPSDVEGLWAIPRGEETFQVDNLPFYVRDISLGDIVATNNRNGRHEFIGLKTKSKNSNLRVSMKKENERKKVLQELEELGGQFETGADLIAILVPEGVPLKPIRTYLWRKYDEGVLDFEEASIRHDS